MKITIDPGTSGCGWAIWTHSWDLVSYGIFIPEEWRGGEYSELRKWLYKAEQVSEKIRQLCWEAVDELYIEYPSVFGGGVAAQSGAVVKLACLVGMIMGNSGAGYRFLVPVQEWKGQMSKSMVEKRIKRILPTCKATSHAIDAIGIGMYKKGVL